MGFSGGFCDLWTHHARPYRQENHIFILFILKKGRIVHRSGLNNENNKNKNKKYLKIETDKVIPRGAPLLKTEIYLYRQIID